MPENNNFFPHVWPCTEIEKTTSVLGMSLACVYCLKQQLFLTTKGYWLASPGCSLLQTTDGSCKLTFWTGQLSLERQELSQSPTFW